MHEKSQEKLNELLNEIEDTLWEDEFQNEGIQVKYTDKTLGSACKIFSHVLLSKMWDYQENQKSTQKQRQKFALKAGKAIRDLVLNSTGIDTHQLYKKGK